MAMRNSVTLYSFAVALAALVPAAAPGSDFVADVRPILERHCFECHSTAKREGGLNLAVAAEARQGGDSGIAAAVAGDLDASAIYQRVTSTDPEDRMPYRREALSEAEIETLRAWILAGADWGDSAPAAPARVPTDHWAFQPPVQPVPPQTADAAWPRNAIDRFVLAKIEAAGRAPSPEADRATLIRRLSLDLTGLPPTLEAVDAFLSDENPDAYERLVEGLLASPHFGERMAAIWLDAARYADSNGYEKDRARSIWPYRDWVIEAYNRDLPYDRFVTEQLAGDLLPEATAAQRIATGFLRNSMLNEEGGIDVEEFRYEAMVDRVNTVGSALLGLTLACAQCHSHKFDPITQREYFQFFAYLNNTDDVELHLPDPAVEARRAEIHAAIEAAIAALPEKFPPDDVEHPGDPAAPEAERRAAHLAAKQAAWESAVRARSVPWQIAQPVGMVSKHHATMETLHDGSVYVSGDRPNSDTYEITLRTALPRITALRIEALPDPRLPGGGPGRGEIMSEGDFLLSEVTLAAAPWSTPDALVAVPLKDPSEDFAANGKTAALALDGKLDTGWSIQGQNGKPHAAVFPLAQPLAHADGTLLKLTLDQYYVHYHTLGRFRISVTDAPLPVVASGVPAEIEALFLKEAAAWSDADRAAVQREFLLRAPELAEEHKQIEQLRASLPKFPSSLVLAEREHPRQTRIHRRGEFLQPAETVTPAVPAIFTPPPVHSPPNRLTLARWIVSTENPLGARVEVNRLWQTFFGRGIVATPEDFGLRGAVPTHPELLDWLAVEFTRRAWSRKEIIRLIVNSATYRQSSRLSPQLLEQDPTNELLARAPRLRVDAEMVRDIALAASGLINPRVGGPSIYPKVPEGLLALVYPDPSGWPTSTGGEEYRRGLYIFWKRTLPFPTATTFDAPMRDRACLARVRTNTPLQALTQLNDLTTMEAARALARRVLGRFGDTEEALEYAFRLCLARPPDAFEAERLGAYMDQQRARLAESPDTVKLLLNEERGEDSVTASWVLLCRVLLNLDETITRG